MPVQCTVAIWLHGKGHFVHAAGAEAGHECLYTVQGAGGGSLCACTRRRRWPLMPVHCTSVQWGGGGQL